MHHGQIREWGTQSTCRKKTIHQDTRIGGIPPAATGCHQTKLRLRVLGCVWVSLGVFMFITTCRVFYLYKRCLVIFDVCPLWLPRHVSWLLVDFPSQSAMEPKYFTFHFWHLFPINRRRSPRAHTCDAMCPLCSGAVGSAASLQVNVCRQHDGAVSALWLRTI